MKTCKHFKKYNAPLCPLDPDIKKRCWFADEPYCRSRIHGQRRWIKKQKSIQKRHTKSWYERGPHTYEDLYNASRPKNISQKRKEELRERIETVRSVLPKKQSSGGIINEGIRN